MLGIGTAVAWAALGAGPAPRRLIRPGALGDGVSFARASGGWATGADGVSFDAYATDQPRFSGPARRLLVEGQRTNSVPNPRGEGGTPGVLGAGGVLPTGVAQAGIPAGLTVEYLGQATYGGLPGWVVRLTGTPAAGAGLTFDHQTSTAMVVAPSEPCALSGSVALVGGSMAGIASISTGVTWRTSSGSSLSGNNSAGITSGVAASSPSAPHRFTRSITSSSDATTARAQQRTPLAFTGEAVDVTLWFGAWMFERNYGFAGTPILPPAGTLAASTRAADVPTWAMPASMANNGALFIKARFLAISAAFQGLAAVDDGTNSSRLLLRVTSAGSLQFVRVGGAGVATAPTLASLTAGTTFAAGLAWEPGLARAQAAGGSEQSLAGTLPTLSRILSGHAAADLSQPGFVEIESADVLLYTPGAAEFAGRLAALAA